MKRKEIAKLFGLPLFCFMVSLAVPAGAKAEEVQPVITQETAQETVQTDYSSETAVKECSMSTAPAASENSGGGRRR